MENIEVLQKPITETKYLATDNSYRYRPIMRYFYQKYEEAKNWIYKEEIYDYMRNIIPEYSMEELERDLATLVENMSLDAIQDNKNIRSLAEFKNRKLRYQMTDYAIQIEKMTIALEEMEVKVASLSPRRFEVLKQYLKNLKEINLSNSEEVSELWNRIENEFKDINDNYKGFLKQFQEAKTEELLQSVAFLEYKDKMVRYLRDFIQGYLYHSTEIKNLINELDNEEFETNFINTLEKYQHSIPTNFNKKYDYQKFRTSSLNRWHNLSKWFVNKNEASEAEKMLDTTNAIIVQITKCANSLQELHGNMIKRKEEYKHIASLFDNISSLEEANKLSSQVFGVISVTHFKGYSRNNTDYIANSYDVVPTIMDVEPNSYKAKERKKNSLIVDKTLEKKMILQMYQDQEKAKKKVLRELLKDKEIILKNSVSLNKIERNYILELISRYGLSNTFKKEPVFGLNYQIRMLKNENSCCITSEDGCLYMPAMEFRFEGEFDE